MGGSQERIRQEAAGSSPSGGPQPGSRSNPISMIMMEEEHLFLKKPSRRCRRSPQGAQGSSREVRDQRRRCRCDRRG